MPACTLLLEFFLDRAQLKTCVLENRDDAIGRLAAGGRAAHAIADRNPDAQWASTGPSNSLRAWLVPSTTLSVNTSLLVAGTQRNPRPASLASSASWAVEG